MRLQSHVLALATLLAATYAYPDFQDRIPNGKRVPNPCPQSRDTTWGGVGHENAAGGGDRNPFGRDFADNDFRWDDCLCQYDSDGDDRTNGEELGDPFCSWTEGDPLLMPKQGLSHPGICEPLDSPVCDETNDWLDCDHLIEPPCPAFDHPDTRRLELVIPRAQVPAEETTYACTAFSLPAGVREGDFHIVGAEAVIDNMQVMHHVLAYGCADDREELITELYGNTSSCRMVTAYCPNLVYIWTFGLGDECYGDQYGYRIGIHGYHTLVLEFHWNNPGRLTDQWDASGVAFYYTPVLRQYDAQNFFTGPFHLEIPPRQERWKQVGYCPEECVENMFPSTVYISKITPHMHYTGRELSVELVSPDNGITVLLNDTTYDYNAPKRFRFSPPVALQHGDSLRVTCVFDSSQQQDWTYFGYDTANEMCVAVVEYFPRQSLSDCMSFGPHIAECTGQVRVSQYGEEVYAQCQRSIWNMTVRAHTEIEYAEIYDNLRQACDTSGRECRPGCADVIQWLQVNNPCFSDAVLSWAKRRVFRKVSDYPYELIQMLMSCDGLDFTVTDQSQSGTASREGSSLKEWCDALDHTPLPDSAPTFQPMLGWTVWCLSFVKLVSFVR